MRLSCNVKRVVSRKQITGVKSQKLGLLMVNPIFNLWLTKNLKINIRIYVKFLIRFTMAKYLESILIYIMIIKNKGSNFGN
jgi:hypothetical protein